MKAKGYSLPASGPQKSAYVVPKFQPDLLGSIALCPFCLDSLLLTGL